MAKTMNPKARTIVNPMLDPFLERIVTPFSARYHLLGSQFSLESNDRRLMRLCAHAFSGLPRHRFPGGSDRLQIRLILHDIDAKPAGQRKGLAPELRTYGWNNVFGATMGPDTLALLSPPTGFGLIVVSKPMLAFPYQLRYELIEFSAFVLAARRRDLVPLHGACIALNGQGVLLLGDRGAGKSVTSLACLADGLEFVAEDGLVVCPTTLLTSGLSSFLHLRADSLHLFHGLTKAHRMLKSPTIVRRSGVPKVEIDVRKIGVKLARSSVEIRAIVFLSGRKSRSAGLATPLARTVARDWLAQSQPYASSLPQWRTFARRISGVPAYAVARGDQPQDIVAAIREILA